MNSSCVHLTTPFLHIPPLPPAHPPPPAPHLIEHQLVLHPLLRSAGIRDGWPVYVEEHKVAMVCDDTAPLGIYGLQVLQRVGLPQAVQPE